MSSLMEPNMEMESIQAKLDKIAFSDEENEESRDDNVESEIATVEEAAFFYDENGQSSNNECIQKSHRVTILKEKLLKHLEEIIVLSRALKLCDLIIKAQKKHECLDRENCKDDHDSQILCDIQNFLEEEPIDEMVELIFITLRATGSDEFLTKQQELKLLLTSFPKEDCRKHAEYLNLLIENMEGLMCLFNFNNFVYSSIDLHLGDCKNNLEKLREFLIYRGKCRVNDLCDIMFRFGTNDINFSLEERERILYLMLQAMPYTGELINVYIFRQESYINIVTCQKRSALQFIRELFPKEDCTEKSAIFSDLLRTLDAIIQFLDDNSKPYDFSELFSDDDDDECYALDTEESIVNTGLIDDDNTGVIDDDNTGVIDDDGDDWYDCYYWHETLDDFIRAGGNKVPKEHTWWQAYREAHFP